MFYSTHSANCFFGFILIINLQNIYGEISNTSNTIRTKRQLENNSISCELPAYPKNGRWMIVKGDGKPGDLISKDTVVKFECDHNYKLSLLAYFVCNSDWNTSKFPVCEKKCPPKYSTPTTTIKCEDKFGKPVACDEAVDGSFLTYSCIPFYEAPFGYKKTAICVEGTWNFPNPICQPVCGKLIEENVTLVANGVVKEKREYPWIIAIFQTSFSNFTICGGTLLSQNIIVTAAHCVTNDLGNALSPKEFMVGAGKYYNKFKDPRDVNVQYVEIDRIVLNPSYRGAPNRFLADIALIITKEFITFNNVIQPVCYQDLPNIHIHPGKQGVLAGWGKTETGEQPDELRILEIPYKHETTCAQELPTDWADKFYTNDKICAGFLNQNKSVCPGDSGSGLYYKNPDDQRYYIHGVVSVGPSINGECNIQQNSLYTKVANYYEFIDKEITKENVEQCSLPKHPKNGKWSIPGQNKNPGDVVPSNTVIQIECGQGYELTSTSSFIDCGSAHMLPECELPCPNPQFPQGTTFICSNTKGDVIDCSKATSGTTLAYSCPAGYKLPTNGNNVKVCQKGSWGRMPECVLDGNTVVEDRYPNERYVVCSYASWRAFEGVFPEDFNATLCSILLYAHIGLQESGDIRVLNNDLELDTIEKGLFRRVTDLKEKNNKLKVLVSVGGSAGTNSSLFSSIASSESKTLAFIYSAIYFVQKYNFDGLSIEWDYPKATDKANYMNLLRNLKEKCEEKGYLLTATVRPLPEDAGYDARFMAGILDFIIVNTYDFYGPWSSYTGQSSPLHPSSLESKWEKDHLNIEAAARNWVKFGVPKSKMVLSISLYTSVLTLSDKNKHGIQAPISKMEKDLKLLRYSQICTDKNWVTVWDDEQKSAYSYYEDKWIGHENNDSVRIKAAYVRDNGYRGLNVWPIDGDDVHGKCGPKQTLLKEINNGLFKNNV